MKFYNIAVMLLATCMFDRDTIPPSPNRLRPQLVLGVKDKSRIKEDHQKGIYLVTIIGLDGKDKVVTFDPATGIDVTVSTHVKYDDQKNKYEYRYTVANGRTSRQRVYDFSVEIGASIENVTDPPGTFSSIRGDKAKEFWENTVWNAWLFSGDDHIRRGIPCGTSENMMAFESNGLPGIVHCFARGDATSYEFDYGEAPSSDEYPSPKPLDNCVRGRTIGPVSPPKEFDATKFSEYLVSLFEECVKEQWISGREEQAKLKELLSGTLQATKAGNTEEWRKTLQSCSTTIYQSGQQVSDEAKQLFKHNIDYALRQK